MRDDVVIIGGGQAALACAVRLREAGHAGDVTILGDEPWLPYQRPPLSKAFLLGKTAIDRLSFRPPEFFEKSGIVLRTGQHAIAIDRARQEVVLAGGDRHRYGRLVLATGSRARTLPKAVTQDLAGIFSLRSIEDAGRLRHALAEAGRVVVIGAGYIGLEVAAISAGLGHQVTVVEIAERILNRVACGETAQAVCELHRSHGVELLTGIGLDRFSASGGRVTGAVLTDGSEVPADLVVVGIGGAANDGLAAESGLAVRNGIVVDGSCRTSDPNIFAAGDCAVFPFEDRMVRLESVQNAIDQGAAVADAIMGTTTAYKPVPWFWSDQYDAKLQSVGLPLDYDRVVSLRSGRANGAAFWYLRAGNAIAVDTINDARTHMAARRLFATDASLSAELLLDPRFDLVQHVRSLAPAASRQ